MAENIQISQLLPSFNHKDAIGNEVCMIQDLLKSKGFESHIYVQRDPGKLPEEYPRPIRYVDEIENGVSSDDILIYHFSTGCEIPNFLVNHPAFLVTRFHNITPPDFFDPIHEAGHRSACALGYVQIPLVRRMSNYFLNISTFNSKTFGLTDRHAGTNLPVLRDYESLKSSNEMPSKIESLFQPNCKNILFVGRLVSNKNIHGLMAAHTLVKKKSHEPVRLILAGYNKSYYARHDLVRLAERLGVGIRFDPDQITSEMEVVCLSGLSDSELALLYEKSDVFAHLSYHEGFCVPLAEAIQHRIPIVASNRGAISETLGSAGVEVDPDNLEEVAIALEGVLSGRISISSNANARSQRKKLFNKLVLENAFYDALDDILEQRDITQNKFFHAAYQNKINQMIGLH